jgi:hypothetical protein
MALAIRGAAAELLGDPAGRGGDHGKDGLGGFGFWVK